MFAALSSEQRVITVNRPLSNTAASHSASQEAVCLIERRVFGPSSWCSDTELCTVVASRLSCNQICVPCDLWWHEQGYDQSASRLQQRCTICSIVVSADSDAWTLCIGPYRVLIRYNCIGKQRKFYTELLFLNSYICLPYFSIICWMCLNSRVAWHLWIFACWEAAGPLLFFFFSFSYLYPKFTKYRSLLK